MGRWTQYDEDEHRLPEGMRRVGYDADSQVYTYQDVDGSLWEGASGARYGNLRPAGRSDTSPSRPNMFADDDGDDGDGDRPSSPTSSYPAKTQQLFNTELHDPEDVRVNGGENPWRLLAPFFLLVGLVLLLLFRLLNSSTAPKPLSPSKACPDGQQTYTIREADTCWAVAQHHGMTVEQLQSLNRAVNCDRLEIGAQLCVSPSQG